MAMDDVDRLFRCFKCGISPPQSAMSETKVKMKKSNQASMESPPSNILSPCSGESQKKKSKIQLETEREEKQGSTVLKRRRQISPIIFYGSPHGVPPKRPSSMLRLLREIQIEIHKEHKSNLRKEVWSTFPRQDEAMKLVKGHSAVHVFSYQDHFSGQRRFLVSTYKEFWKRYKQMDSKLRHHYEVIQEGLPCHLYFDLEFNRRENLEKDGNEMVDLLITVVFKALREKYSIEGNLEWVVELDSSTAEKFSRHLVIRIPNTAFKDNSHVGAFVAEICSQITSAKEKDISFKKLFISKESGSAEHQYQLFVDTAVYSRNRCFRLPLSSKAGKSSVLLPTGRFKCKDMSEEDMFMASLICNMDTHCKKLLVWKMELECIKTLHFNTEVYQDYGNRSLNSLDWRQNSPVSDVSNAYFIGKSPFPALDAFIESVASTGNISGRIRSWYWFSEYEMMIYSMSRNRYCERIGREHKSNHVMYVVDFRRATYYQKCHDPDCRGYRSPSRQVPWDVLPYSTYSLNLEAMELQGTSTDKESCHLGDNKQESLPLGEKSPDSCMKDGWWLEAIKFADHVENMQKALEVCYMENADDEDDEEWWTEVEQTAARVELMLSQPNDMKLLC